MTQGRRWCVFARKAVWNRPASTENESKALVGGKEARAVRGDATIRAHKSGMNRAANSLKLAFLCLAVLSLSSCAGGRTVGEHIADMPPWMGGLPADAPPRRGSPEYDAWMAKRAQEAATPKTDQQQPK
jgi:hypothetical protein